MLSDGSPLLSPLKDIEQGKEKATEYAEVYRKRVNVELPPLIWKKARTA